MLIPDFVNLATYGNSEEEQEIGNNPSGAKIVLHAEKGKPRLEQITLSMWVAANLRIIHELLKAGKLSVTTSDILDYLAYTVKFAELCESHTLASVVVYNNEYCKLQCEYGFRWGSDSQHLHTKFLVRYWPLVPGAQAMNWQKVPSTPKPPTTRILHHSYLQDVIGLTVIISTSAWCQTVIKDTHSMSITQPLLCDSE